MNARVTRQILRVLERHTPAGFSALQIQVLLNITARGFGVPAKQVWHLGASRALREYAKFTWACMETAMESPEGIDTRRLYQSAYRAGKRLREITGLTKDEDAARLVFYLYRGIRITMEGELPGEVIVSDCYFSKFYGPAQCAVMSNVDAGIIAGICGGGNFQFTERITEGCGRCRACLTERSERP